MPITYRYPPPAFGRLQPEFDAWHVATPPCPYNITKRSMADGFNEVRALRLAEIMQDFRDLQQCLSNITASPAPNEHDWIGFVVLRRCSSEGLATLTAGFIPSERSPDGDPESEKAQLAPVILDASARRFVARRAYQRASLAVRCVNTRSSILQEQLKDGTQEERIQDLEDNFKDKLSELDDGAIFNELRALDDRQGKWVDEDPTLDQIVTHLRGKSPSRQPS